MFALPKTTLPSYNFNEGHYVCFTEEILQVKIYQHSMCVHSLELPEVDQMRFHKIYLHKKKQIYPRNIVKINLIWQSV